MANTTRGAQRSEKGLLTPDNCVVTIIDLQPQMLFGVGNFDRQWCYESPVYRGLCRVCCGFRSDGLEEANLRTRHQPLVACSQ
jgi:hypothetical protein